MHEGGEPLSFINNYILNYISMVYFNQSLRHRWINYTLFIIEVNRGQSGHVSIPRLTCKCNYWKLIIKQHNYH